jgi:hypothetical protein
MQAELPTTEYEVDRIILRDVQSEKVKISHRRIEHGRTYTAAEYTTDYLPIEFLSILSEGVVDLSELTDEERKWMQTEGSNLEFG